MHQGKHQEYEKRLHDTLIAQMSQQPLQTTLGTNPATTTSATTATSGTGTTTTTTAAGATVALTNLMNGANVSNGGSSINGMNGDVIKETNGTTNGSIQSKEAWPSLSTSPVNNKENKLNGKTSKFSSTF